MYFTKIFIQIILDKRMVCIENNAKATTIVIKLSKGLKLKKVFAITYVATDKATVKP